MTQDEMEQMFQALGAFATRQQQINEQQAQLNERLVTVIERIDVTIQAIKDMLERGNGH